MTSLSPNTVQNIVSSSRADGKDLLLWFKVTRGQDTLSCEKAELFYARFVRAGYPTIKSLEKFDWTRESLAKVTLDDDDIRWLSAWFPREYGEENTVFDPLRHSALAGIWEDSVGMRICGISIQGSLYTKADPHYYVQELHNRTDYQREFARLSLLLQLGEQVATIFSSNHDQPKITLHAPWGKNGAWRTWNGTVDQNGTRISWEGRRGVSYWYRITE